MIMIGRFFQAIFDFIIWILQTILKIVIACVVLFLIFIVTQEFQIFPALFTSVLEKSTRPPGTTPPDIVSTYINTPDGKKLEVWTLKAENKNEQHHAALILNGGEGVIDDYLPYQRWFQSLGITSYQVEWRGLGRSTGWVSEKGFYTDAEAALNFVMGQEEISAKNMIVMGITLGSAPAAYITKRFQVGTLVLMSPVTKLSDLFDTHQFKQYLNPFLWYSLPTIDFLKETPACVVMAHGRQDPHVPFSHFERIKAEYSGKGPLREIISENATHVNLLALEKDAITIELRQCLGIPNPLSIPTPVSTQSTPASEASSSESSAIASEQSS